MVTRRSADAAMGILGMGGGALGVVMQYRPLVMGITPIVLHFGCGLCIVQLPS